MSKSPPAPFRVSKPENVTLTVEYVTVPVLRLTVTMREVLLAAPAVRMAALESVANNRPP